MEHLVNSGLVLIPLLAVSPVLIGDLPLFFGSVLAVVEALELCVFVDLHPEFDDDGAPVGQFLLKFIHLVIGALPVILAAEAFNALHHDASVPGAVKDRDVAVLGKPVPEPPKEVPGLLVGFRAGDGMHFIAAGIQSAGDPLDIAALAGCVPALIGNNDRDLLAVEFIVQIPQFLLQTIQLLVVFLFGYSLVIQRYFGELGNGAQGEYVLAEAPPPYLAAR